MPKINIHEELDVPPLMKAIRVKASEPGMSLTKIAARLDVSASQLTALSKNRRHPRLAFLQAVYREYPDLRHLVIDYLHQFNDEQDTSATFTQALKYRAPIGDIDK